MTINGELLFELVEDLVNQSSDKVFYSDGCSPEDAAYADGVADGRSEVINQLKEILVVFKHS